MREITTLSDFMDMPVRRTGDVAELLFGAVYVAETGETLPVRLLGFVEDAALPDFEIRERGFAVGLTVWCNTPNFR